MRIFCLVACFLLASTISAQSPWLPTAEQNYVKALWPEGVPLPPTLKFYKLKPAGQSVAAFGTPGAGNHYRFMPSTGGADNPNRDFPWVGSGGMDFAKKGTWRNVTGMSLPVGKKIAVWKAPMPVKNSLGSIQREIAMHWSFPTGTQMFDVLIRRNADGSEHIFNIRRRVKQTKGWDDGASFMPAVEANKTEVFTTVGGKRSRQVLGVPKISFKFGVVQPITEHVKFQESSLALTDGGNFFPPGFKGTGLSCNKCHNGQVHESKTYGGILLRGKDTVFSFYPIVQELVLENEAVPSNLFNSVYMPYVDTRWPIEFIRK